MKGETVNIAYNIKRAEAFLDAMNRFTDKFVAKNYAINVVIDYQVKWVINLFAKQ